MVDGPTGERLGLDGQRGREGEKREGEGRGECGQEGEV